MLSGPSSGPGRSGTRSTDDVHRGRSASWRFSSEPARRPGLPGPVGAVDAMTASRQDERKPILIAYDGSAPARAATERAGSLLSPGPAVVICVWTSMRYSAPAALLGAPASVVVARRRARRSGPRSGGAARGRGRGAGAAGRTGGALAGDRESTLRMDRHRSLCGRARRGRHRDRNPRPIRRGRGGPREHRPGTPAPRAPAGPRGGWRLMAALQQVASCARASRCAP